MSHIIRASIVVVVACAACVPEDDSSPTAGITKPPPTCEEIACSHVADCSPTLTGGVDWRTSEACLADGWECYDAEACLAAVAALPCLSEPPTWEELEDNTRAFVEVRRACLGPPY